MPRFSTDYCCWCRYCLPFVEQGCSGQQRHYLSARTLLALVLLEEEQEAEQQETKGILIEIAKLEPPLLVPRQIWQSHQYCWRTRHCCRYHVKIRKATISIIVVLPQYENENYEHEIDALMQRDLPSSSSSSSSSPGKAVEKSAKAVLR
jgi:hypothetical protein